MKTKLSLSITALLTFFAFVALPLNTFAQDSTIKTVSVYAFAGAPSGGTSEIDTLTIQTSTTSGTFTIAVAGQRTTAPITWSATNATLVANVDAALEATPTIGVGGVTTAVGTMTAGIGTITITMAGKNAKRNMPALSIGTNSLVGGAAPTLTTTTEGVDATFRDAATGTLLVDTSTPDLYINDSTTAGSPTWTKVSP
jgi:phage tail sheath gpL-like